MNYSQFKKVIRTLDKHTDIPNIPNESKVTIGEDGWINIYFPNPIDHIEYISIDLYDDYAEIFCRHTLNTLSYIIKI